MKPLAKLIGQALAVELLERIKTTRKIAPAYLFVGTEGVGKALAARCFAEMLLISDEDNYQQVSHQINSGNHPDFLWVEPTYNNKGELLTVKQAQEQGLKRKTVPQIRIEQVREISEFLARPPLKADRCFVVIESAHLMAESAGNALLKTLENPGKATIILIANSSDSILTTLVSRCQSIPFFRLSEEDLKLVLSRAGASEVFDYPQLINLAQGSPGKAIEHWQKLTEVPTDLMSQLNKLPFEILNGFNLAKEISSNLELDVQIWLADYLQYLYWEKKRDLNLVESLENNKRLLKRYVQPRLVWDCFFLNIR